MGLSSEVAYFLSAEEYCCACGNTVRVVSLNDDTERFIPGGGFGIGAVAACPALGILAFVEEGPQPLVHFHRADTLERVQTLAEASLLGLSAMAFSRDGSRLATAGLEPDQRLVVWDWREARVLVEEKCSHHVGQVSFNPLDDDQLVTTGDGRLSFWTIEKLYQKLFFTEYKSASRMMDPECHAWSPNGGIWVGCLGGEVVIFNFKDTTPLELQTATGDVRDMRFAGPVKAIAVTGKHAIVGGDGFPVTWLNLINPEKRVSDQLLEPQYELDTRTTTSHVHLSPDHRSLLVTSSEASIYLIDNINPEVQEPEMYVLGDYHNGPVTGVAAFPDRPVAASVGEDGTLRLWDTVRKKLLATRQFVYPQTSVCASKHADGLLVIGGSNGVVRAVVAGAPARPVVTFRKRLHAGEVVAAAFSRGGDCVATARTDGRIFFLAVDGLAVSILGYVKVPDKIEINAIAWMAKAPGNLLIAAKNGELLAVEQPARGTPAENHFLEAVSVLRLKIDAPVLALASGTGMTEGAAFTLSVDHTMKKYVLPADVWAKEAGRGKGKQPENKCSAHMKQGTGMCITKFGDMVLTVGLDGGVALRATDQFGNAVHPMLEGRLFSIARGGGSGVALDCNEQRVVASGNDGALFICRMPGSPEKLEPAAAADPEHGLKDVDALDQEDEAEVTQLRAGPVGEAGQSAAVGTFHQELKAKLEDIQFRFEDIKKQNEDNPERAQLPPTEFIIDKELVEMSQKLTEEKTKKLQGSIRLEIAKKQMQVELIKQDCWDSAKTQTRSIFSFSGETSVENFAVLQDEAFDQKYRQLSLLRRVELAEEACNGGIGAFNTGRVAAGAGLDEVPGSPTGKMEAPEDFEEEEVKEKSETEKILYNDFELAQPARKATQIILLRKLALEKKVNFNKLFNESFDRKQSDSARIGDFNTRIEELSHDLARLAALDSIDVSDMVDVEPFAPELKPPEQPETFLTVTDAEVGVSKYVSPEELAQLEEERRAEEARRNARKKDPFERALTEMMGGTLDKARQEEEAVLEKPEWMLGDPKLFTEDQVKLVKEFEAKEAFILEEREKKRKGLETELRKIRADIAEVSEKFDESLQTLLDTRHDLETEIHQIDFRIIALTYAIDKATSTDEIREAALVAELQELGERTMETTAAVTEFRAQLSAAHQKVDEKAAEDRALEKSFKRDFAECEEDFDTLVKLFRRRVAIKDRDPRSPDKGPAPPQGRRGSVMMKGGQRRASIMNLQAQQKQIEAQIEAQIKHTQRMSQEDDDLDDLASPVDPEDPWFGAMQAKRAEARAAALAARVEPLNPSYDWPEGLDPEWWEKLNAARETKIASEAAVKAELATVAEMEKYMLKLADEDEELKATSDTVLRNLTVLRETREQSFWDLHVPLALKQGQVEILVPLTSSDVSDAIFLERAVVEEQNEVIKRHGSQKVDVLQAIKDFKKGIYDAQWENQKCNMLEEDWIEKTKEFQLLRVTKSLQKLIKNGEDTANNAEVLGLEHRLDHNRRLHVKKVDEKHLFLRKTQAQISQKKLQNSQFADEVMDIKGRIVEQDRLQETQFAEDSTELNLQKRMRSLVTQRKLKDIAKAQAEEVAVLKQELEKLRLRTYPSFIEKHFLPPDEAVPGGVMGRGG